MAFLSSSVGTNLPSCASELALARRSSASCAAFLLPSCPCHVLSTVFCSARA